MELTTHNLDMIMREVLLTGAETEAANLPDDVIGNELPVAPESVILIHGAVTIYGFSKDRLLARTDDIKSMISQLPREFFVNGGGGWSLINAVSRADGELWSSQIGADALFCLGRAIGVTKYLMPRDIWSVLPCGMPYFAVNLDGFKYAEEYE